MHAYYAQQQQQQQATSAGATAMSAYDAYGQPVGAQQDPNATAAYYAAAQQDPYAQQQQAAYAQAYQQQVPQDQQSQQAYYQTQQQQQQQQQQYAAAYGQAYQPTQQPQQQPQYMPTQQQLYDYNQQGAAATQALTASAATTGAATYDYNRSSSSSFQSQNYQQQQPYQQQQQYQQQPYPYQTHEQQQHQQQQQQQYGSAQKGAYRRGSSSFNQSQPSSQQQQQQQQPHMHPNKHLHSRPGNFNNNLNPNNSSGPQSFVGSTAAPPQGHQRSPDVQNSSTNSTNVNHAGFQRGRGGGFAGGRSRGGGHMNLAPGPISASSSAALPGAAALSSSAASITGAAALTSAPPTTPFKAPMHPPSGPFSGPASSHRSSSSMATPSPPSRNAGALGAIPTPPPPPPPQSISSASGVGRNIRNGPPQVGRSSSSSSSSSTTFVPPGSQLHSRPSSTPNATGTGVSAGPTTPYPGRGPNNTGLGSGGGRPSFNNSTLGVTGGPSPSNQRFNQSNQDASPYMMRGPRAPGGSHGNMAWNGGRSSNTGRGGASVGGARAIGGGSVGLPSSTHPGSHHPYARPSVPPMHGDSASGLRMNSGARFPNSSMSTGAVGGAGAGGVTAIGLPPRQPYGPNSSSSSSFRRFDRRGMVTTTGSNSRPIVGASAVPGGRPMYSSPSTPSTSSNFQQLQHRRQVGGNIFVGNSYVPAAPSSSLTPSASGSNSIAGQGFGSGGTSQNYSLSLRNPGLNRTMGNPGVLGGNKNFRIQQPLHRRPLNNMNPSGRSFAQISASNRAYVPFVRKIESASTSAIVTKDSSLSSSTSLSSGNVLASSIAPLSSVKMMAKHLLGSIPTYTLNQLRRSVLDIRCRYPRLQIPDEFSVLHSSWTEDEGPLADPEMINNEEGMLPLIAAHPVCAEIFEEALLPQDDAELENEDDDLALKGSSCKDENGISIRWSSKVLLILNDIPENDRAPESVIGSGLRMLVGQRKDSGSMMLIGGAWCAEKDGGDPNVDGDALISTAIRTVREATQIDLSTCERWVKFLEFQYQRTVVESMDDQTGEELLDITVVWLVDLRECIPSHEQFVDTWNHFEKLRMEKAAAAMQHTEKKVKSEQESATSSKSTSEGTTETENHESKIKNESSADGETKTKTESDVTDSAESENATVNQNNPQENMKTNTDKHTDKETDASAATLSTAVEEKSSKPDTSLASNMIALRAPPPASVLIASSKREDIQIKAVPLDSILDINDTDLHESSFEVYITAEALLETMQRSYGRVIIDFLRGLRYPAYQPQPYHQHHLHHHSRGAPPSYAQNSLASHESAGVATYFDNESEIIDEEEHEEDSHGIKRGADAVDDMDFGGESPSKRLRHMEMDGLPDVGQQKIEDIDGVDIQAIQEAAVLSGQEHPEGAAMMMENEEMQHEHHNDYVPGEIVQEDPADDAQLPREPNDDSSFASYHDVVEGEPVDSERIIRKELHENGDAVSRQLIHENSNEGENPNNMDGDDIADPSDEHLLPGTLPRTRSVHDVLAESIIANGEDQAALLDEIKQLNNAKKEEEVSVVAESGHMSTYPSDAATFGANEASNVNEQDIAVGETLASESRDIAVIADSKPSSSSASADPSMDMQEDKASIVNKVIDIHRLRAFRFFDRQGNGFVLIQDLENILFSLDECLSKRSVDDLISGHVGEDDRLYYGPLVSKSR